MIRENYTIPGRSRAAISEACDAALLRAAFLELEEEEFMKYRSEMSTGIPLSPKQLEFARSLRRKARSRRARAAVLHALPRLAQAAACLIAVFAIGMGVALAASPAARSWATGLLTANVEPADAEIVEFFGDPDMRAGFETGAALEDTLYAYQEEQESIYVQTGTDAQPAIYRWKNRENRSMEKLTAGADGLFALCAVRNDTGKIAEGLLNPYDRFELCRVRFDGADGFTLESVAAFVPEELFQLDGRAVQNQVVENFFYGNDRFYIGVYWEYEIPGYMESEYHRRLYAYDPAAKDLTEVSLPPVQHSWYGETEVFGDGGTVLVSAIDLGNQRVCIGRIEPDGGSSLVASVPQRAGLYARCFAYRALTDTLYYLLDGSIYAARGCDIDRAERVAITTVEDGQALLLGENSYGIFDADGAHVYNFDSRPGDVTELCVDGSLNTPVENAFLEAHPGVTIVSDPATERYDYDCAAVLASGDSEADLWVRSEGDYFLHLDRGAYRPIESDVLKQAVADMYPGIRDLLTRDGQLVAFPVKLYAYPDVSFCMRAIEAMGLTKDDLPQTWADFLRFLADLSHSPRAQMFPILNASADERNAKDFSAKILTSMITGWDRLCIATGRELDYADPEFSGLLDLYRQIDFDAFRYVAKEDNSESDLLDLESIYAFYVLDDSFYYRLTLRFSAGGPRIASGSGSFAVFNPDGDNTALALELLEYSHSACDLSETFNAYARGDQSALPNAYLDPGDIEAYRARVDDVRLSPRAYQNALWPSIYETLNKFAAGELSNGDLISILNNVYAKSN